MIIKSHIRGGYRAAADYMKDIGKNEKTRLVEISDPKAKNLDDAFHNMWVVANCTKCTKPLHHISINPMKDERLTDEQVLKIVERCEEKYGYRMFHHQRVIIEHVRDGRQHFHVIWNRVSLVTGSPVWPGHHWIKSKQVCREMEKELGLKSPAPRRSHGTKPRGRKNSGGKRRTASRPGGKLGSTKPALNATRPLPVPTPRLSVRTKAPEERSAATPAPVKPALNKRRWPLAAVIDWELWGHRNPRRFFALWPELAL